MEATNLTVTTDETKILIPEPQEMKLVGKEADQVGGCRNEVVAEAKQAELTLDWPVDREQWIQSVMTASESDWFDKIRKHDRLQSQEQRILKVNPSKFLGKEYTPEVVSIGPYHFGITELRKMDKLKVTMAGLFLDTKSDDKLELAKILKQLAKVIKELKDENQLYDQINIEEEKLVRMMLLDGCFIIVFMVLFIDSSLGLFGLKKTDVALIQQDLFKVENQIPFKVFDALCGEETFIKRNMHLKVLDRYFRSCTAGNNRNFKLESRYKDITEAQPLHLLDLLRITWLGDEKGKRRGNSYGNNINHPKFCDTVGRACRDVTEALLYSFKSSRFCLFQKLGTFFLDVIEKSDYWSGFLFDQSDYLLKKGRVIRNVKLLKEAGIYLRPNESNLLSDIHFNSFLTGTLTLPPIIIDGLSETLFLNMIALEYCKKNDYGFTSYVSLLDSLIDNAEDVKLMHDAGVLEHFLNNDDEVATLINRIGANLVPEEDTYEHVKRKIYDYLESKSRSKVGTWVAEVKQTHFSTPWSIIALFAAFFVILLTIVQTYFAIFPRSPNNS